MPIDVDETRFGSGKSGLLCGYLFRPNQRAEQVDAAQAETLLAEDACPPPGTFLWLHLNSANQAADRWLSQTMALPPALRTTLQHAKPTRVDWTDGTLVAVLSDVTMNERDVFGLSSMVVWAGRPALVTVRSTPLRSIDRLRQAVKDGETFASPFVLLARLLRDQAVTLEQIVVRASIEVDQLEDTLINEQVPASRPRLGALRRMLVRLQRALAPEPPALARWLNRPPGWLDEMEVDQLRDSSEQLSSAVAECATLIERVRLLQEELFAIVNEHTNRTLFVLTVLTALVAPMTIVSSFFGMNVTSIPLQDHPGGFWIVVALTTLGTAAAGVFLFRRRIDR